MEEILWAAPIPALCNIDFSYILHQWNKPARGLDGVIVRATKPTKIRLRHSSLGYISTLLSSERNDVT